MIGLTYAGNSLPITTINLSIHESQAQLCSALDVVSSLNLAIAVSFGLDEMYAQKVIRQILPIAITILAVRYFLISLM